MARETVFIIQAFVLKGKALHAEAPVGCLSAEAARRKAEKLAPARAGVIAYSMTADAELGDYDEAPIFFFKAGRLPTEFEDV